MSNRFIYIFLIMSVMFAFAMSYALSHLIPVDYWVLFVNEFIHSLIFSALSVVIWQLIRYGNYSALSIYQRFINYIAIGVLVIAVWLFAGYWLFYLIFNEQMSALIEKTIWIKGVFGSLLYVSLIQYFYYQNCKKDISIQADESQEETIPYETNSTQLLERIAVKSGQKIHVVMVTDILYMQAEGDYVKIHTDKGKYLKEETMKFFQENLSPKQFVRVHRSYIVNVEMIQRIDVYEKQNQLLTLKNGEKIKASTTGYKQLKLALNL